MALALTHPAQLRTRFRTRHIAGEAAPSVHRALAAIKSHQVPAEQIDYAILAAINVTLCLLSGSDDRVAEGFNRDIAGSGGRSRLS